MACVVFTISDAIESHRGRARSHHCHDYPNYLPRRRNPARRQHCAEKSKRQREQRVLDLDHLERRADIAYDSGGHIELLVWLLTLLRLSNGDRNTRRKYTTYGRL